MEGAKNTGEVASDADLAAIAEGCARECEKKGLLEVAFCVARGFWASRKG